MKSNSKKNAKKTIARANRGGHRDVKKFPTEFGPAKGKSSAVNFYGHMSYSRAKQLKRAARKLRAATERGDKNCRDALIAKLPFWTRRVLAK